MARKKSVEDDLDRLLSIDADIRVEKLKAQVASLRSQYRASLAAVESERQRAESLSSLKGIAACRLPSRRPVSRPGTATAVVLLSDWHIEERVLGSSCGGLNEFDLGIADRRIAELSDRIEMLIEHERRLVRIDRIVIAAIGDFISNIIHDDTAELAQLQPAAAMRRAGERLRAIIDRAAGMADEVLVVTAVGNHGRSVMKPRVATEAQHSWEQNAYIMMAESERNENVRWQIGEGYLNVADLDGYKIAFHHGHGITGNVHVGANRAIAQWQRSTPVDMHCFGHHHQFAYCRGKYLCNGSLIGYNAYALRVVKAEFEPPCQALAVIDHDRRECTKAIPIFCDRDLQEKKRCRQSRVGTSRTSAKRTRSSGRSSKRGTSSGTKVRKR